MHPRECVAYGGQCESIIRIPISIMVVAET